MNLQIHHYFAFIGLIFGVLILWVTPPFQSPDETNHYHRSAHIAQGHLMGEVLDGNRLGGEIDGSLLKYTSHFDSIRKSEDPRFDAADYTWARGLRKTGKLFVDFANVGYYSPTVYFPQVVGQALSQLLRLTPYQSLYFTRLLSLLSWLTLITLAIRIIPIQKILICFLALLPSSLSLASMVSGDTFTSSLCFLWIALLLRMILTKHRISLKEYIIICLIIVFITLNKLVYFPLVFMILLVPNDRLKKSVLMKSILLCITGVTLLLWMPYSKSLFIPYSEYSHLFRDSQQLNPPVNPDAQLSWILSHPYSFAQVALISYLESAPSTIAHYIGKYGWEKNYLHPIIIAILGLVGGFLSISRAENAPKLNVTQRLSFIVISLVMIIGLSVSLYLQWSPVGNDRILSLSGRYFFPIIPLLLIAASFINIENQRRIKLLSLGLSIVGLISLIIAIYSRWY